MVPPARALLAAVAAAAAAACLGQSAPSVSIISTAFKGGDGGYSCFRIPSVVRTAKGTLLAFAEARHGSCSDGAVHEIALRRSLDNGKTWGPVAAAAGDEQSYVGNPDAVVLKSGRVLLVYVKHSPKCNGDCGVGNGVVYSDDDGASWSKENDVSKDFGPASGSLPGPGVALQAASGRVLVISHHSAYQRDYVTYSDDDGKSWTTAGTTFPAMDEAQMTQLPDGSLMVNMRHQKSKTLGRGTAISRDDGATWSSIAYDKALVSPVCQASIVTFGNVTYFSNPANPIGRFNTTVKYSLDNAKTWSAGVLIEGGHSAGYSCLVKGAVTPGHGGILFESVNMTIQFALFPLASTGL